MSAPRPEGAVFSSTEVQSLSREVLLPLLRNCIRQGCVNTGVGETGGEYRSVEILREFFAARGLEGEVLCSPEGRSAGRENFLVRLPGTAPEAPVLLLNGHLDVVPAETAAWDFPPFEGTLVREGRVLDEGEPLTDDTELYGRGTVDMLNMTCTMAVALALLAERGWRPRGDIIFLASADEENASTYGVQWLVENHWDKVRCDYMITELGGFFAGPPDNPAIALTVGEKGVAWAQLRFSGTPGHGSLPFRADNAVHKGAQALSRLVRDWEAAETGEIPRLYRTMVEGLGLPSAVKEALLDPEARDTALNGLAQDFPGEARFLHAASRSTLSAGQFLGGVKTNIIPAEAVIEVDLRVLPGETRESLNKRLREKMGPAGETVDIRFTDFFESRVSPAEGLLMDRVTRAAEKVHPGVPLVPFLIGGVTDARFFRARGVTAYGITLFSRRMTLEAFSQRIHGDNERIDLESLEKGLQFFLEVAGNW